MAASTYDSPEEIVDAIIDRLGTEIVVGTPLGIGKPNHILNELVERALEDETIELSIWTALSLSKPGWDSELERRLVEPIEDRLFGSYPNLTYATLLDEQELPANISVHEFYYPPGNYVGNASAQQSHHSVNYTHALDAFEAAEPDLLLQLVGVGEYQDETHYNIASNTDLSTDLIESMQAAREAGDRDCMIVGQVNRNMPFMYGDAPVPADDFDAVLDSQSHEFPLFAPPNEPVSFADQAIGLRVSALLADGGTLQIGIGSLGDAIGHATALRHTDNETYRAVLDDLGTEHSEALIEEIGGLDPFETGLYGATEMFVEAFLQLYEAGVLSREVYDHPAIQQLADEGLVDDGPTLETLDRLQTAGAIDTPLSAEDVSFLKRWGLFRESVSLDGDELVIDTESDGKRLSTALDDPEARVEIAEHALGDGLKGGRVLHGGFFMGSADFYEGLRELPAADRRKLAMTSVQFTNELYGREELKRRQRRDARFVNTGMKATLLGGVASDGTESGQVVSGVGGQFNFVNQAHELEDGRSIIMIRATRQSGGKPESNIVWQYGHATIPRHLRDIVVTEYGVADLRGKRDEEIVAEMIKIADSRFQKELIEKAKSAGKLPADWKLPKAFKQNYPERIERALSPHRERGDLPQFPYGSDLSSVERELAGALRGLQGKFAGDGLPELPALSSLKKTLRVPSAAQPYLERMELSSVRSPQEFALKRAVILALAEQDIV